MCGLYCQVISTVCPWKVRLIGFELQRRKTLSQVPAFLWESRCLNDICYRDLVDRRFVHFRSSFGQIRAYPSCPTCEMVVFFSNKTSSWHVSISADVLNPSNTSYSSHLNNGYLDIIYTTNLYNKTWPRTDPMEEFFRNGCRSTQPAIWRSLRGVMESATCCRTTRHRGMATLSRFQERE